MKTRPTLSLAFIAVMSFSPASVHAGFTITTYLNGVQNGTIYDSNYDGTNLNAVQVTAQGMSTTAGQTFGDPSGNGSMNMQVVNQTITAKPSMPNNTVGVNGMISIVVSDGMGDSGTITLMDQSTGSFDNTKAAPLALDLLLVLKSPTTFNVGATTFTFNGFKEAGYNPFQQEPAYQGSVHGTGTTPYSLALTAEFSYSGPAIPSVPEPSSLLLVTMGMAGAAGVGAWKRGRMKQSASL